MIGPLMLVFAAKGLFSEANAKLLPAVSAAATSLAQPLMGLLGDKGMPKAFSLAGPAFAAAGVCLAMVAGRAELVLVWLLIGGLGVAIYHPEAAVMATSDNTLRAAMSTSIFLFGGTVGLWLGPLTCGWLLANLSVESSAALLAPPGLLIGLGLGVAAMLRARIAAARPKPTYADVPGGGEVGAAAEGRNPSAARINGPLILLTAQAIFRSLAMGAVGVIVPWWAYHHGADMTHVGLLSGLFLFAGGIGMLLIGWLCWPRQEKAILVGTGLAGIVPIWLLGRAETLWQGALCIVAGGILVNGTASMLVAMAQRVAPQGARMASALTMGFAWGIGGTAGPFLVWQADKDATALLIAAVALLPAVLCAAALPGRILGGPAGPDQNGAT